jgi:hypothetical protein
VTGYADTYVMRVAGLPYTWSTAPLVYDPTARAVVSSVPGTLRQKLELFKPTGSDSGVEVSLVYGDDAQPLLDRTIAPVVDASGVPVRLADAVDDLATALPVTAAPVGLAPGDVISVGGEAVTYLSTGAGVINVTRGALGSIAAPIPAAFVLLLKPATVIGSRVVLSRVPFGGTLETVVFQGRITAVAADAGNVRLTIGSTWSSLRSRKYAPPRNDNPASARASIERGTDGFVLASAGDDGPLRLSLGDAGAFPADVSHAWVGSDDLRVCAEVTVAAGGVVVVPAGARIAQAFDGDRMISAAEIDARVGAEFSIDSVIVADVLAGPLAPSLVVSAVLQGQTPATMRGGLDAAELGDLTALDGALGIASFASPTLSTAAPLVVLPPAEKPLALLKYVGQLLEPAGVVMVPDSRGRIAIVDPVESSLVPTSVTGDQLRAPALSWSVDESTALRAVTIAAPFEGVDYTARIVSDVASQLYSGGVELDIDAGLWSPAADSLRIRWRSVVTWLQRGVPVFGAEIERGTAVDVGDLVLVDVPTLVDGDGTRGVSGLLCSILERGETTRNGKQAVTLLALGHGLKLRLGAWSPTAEVSAYAAGVATVGTLFTGTDDAAPFTAGQAVFLLDANGTRIDTDAPPATVTGVGPLSLKVTFATATPAATDLIVLAQYDDVAIRDVYAWQADPAGTLGAGLEAAFTWG